MLNLVHEPRPSLCGGGTPQVVATSRVSQLATTSSACAATAIAAITAMRDAGRGRPVFGFPSWGSATVGHAMRWF
jgi:hypothetical protein